MAKLHHFVRTPTWVIPPRIMTMKIMGGPAKEILPEIELDASENFSAAQKERFRSDPVFYRKFVKAIEKDLSGTFPLVSDISDQ